jgi:hypothetical protein
MKPEWEIRKDKEGNFDEIVAEDVQFFHLERMNTDMFWLGITLQDGSRITANLISKPVLEDGIYNSKIELSTEREEV